MNTRRKMQNVVRSTLATVVALVVFVAPAGASATTDTTIPDDGGGVDGERSSDTGGTNGSSEGSFAVQPSGPDGPGGRDYFVYTLDPGQVFGDTVGISNLGSEPVTYALYATDAFNTEETASFALLREEETPEGVGSWIDLGVSQVTVDPGTRVDVPFKIEVPDGATPGDHAGAVVAQEIPDAESDDDGVTVDVRLRIGARVYVRVGGELSPSLTIEQLTIDHDTPLNPLGTGPATVEYVVANTGNVRIEAEAMVEIDGMLGLGGGDADLRLLPELLPGSSIQITETIDDVRPLVRLTATLRLQAPIDGVDVERSVSTWAVPWIVLILVLVLIGLLVRYLLRRSQGRGGSEKESEQEVPA